MDKKKIHFYYGIILLVVGIGVFFRIPHVMEQVETIEFFRRKLVVIKACCYILGILMVYAGVLRIYKNYK